MDSRFVRYLAGLACEFANSCVHSTQTHPKFNDLPLDVRWDKLIASNYVEPFRRISERDKIINVIYNACFAYKTSYGNCGELSTLAFLYLIEYMRRYSLQERLGVNIACLPDNLGHQFLLICPVVGGGGATDPSCYIVCDPLFNDVYSLNEFFPGRLKGCGFHNLTGLNVYQEYDGNNGLEYYLSAAQLFADSRIINPQGNILNQIALGYLFNEVTRYGFYGLLADDVVSWWHNTVAHQDIRCGYALHVIHQYFLRRTGRALLNINDFFHSYKIFDCLSQSRMFDVARFPRPYEIGG